MNDKQNLKIFIVDDDIFHSNLLNKKLKNIGIEKNIILNSGEQCLKKINEQPDIVFLDYNMNGLNGHEVLKKIKKKYPEIYIIIFSAQKEINIAVECLKSGAFDYIQKGQNSLEKIPQIIKKIRIVKKQNIISSSNIFNKLLKFSN